MTTKKRRREWFDDKLSIILDDGARRDDKITLKKYLSELEYEIKIELSKSKNRGRKAKKS